MELGRRLDELKALATTDPARTIHLRAGESVTFLRGAAETGGEYAFVRVVLAPGGGNGLTTT